MHRSFRLATLSVRMTSLLGQWTAIVLFLTIFGAHRFTAQTTPASKQQILWQKLESAIGDVDRGLDGVLGVAIEDLTSGQRFLLRGNEVFPQASSRSEERRVGKECRFRVWT